MEIPEKEPPRVRNRTSKKPPPKSPADTTGQDSGIKDYTHEIVGWADYKKSTGALKREGANENTQIDSSTISTKFWYGYLLGDHAEPFFEVGYSVTEQKIADYTQKKKVLDWGIGMLFNIPGAPDQEVEYDANVNAPNFSQASFIPYGGVVVTTKSVVAEEGASTIVNSNDDEMVTKLIFGLRWVPVDHLGLNFSLRVSHQKGESVAESGEKVGGSTSKTLIEAQMFAITLLL